jgi:hypothetical protein
MFEMVKFVTNLVKRMGGVYKIIYKLTSTFYPEKNKYNNCFQETINSKIFIIYKYFQKYHSFFVEHTFKTYQLKVKKVFKEVAFLVL